MKKFYAIYDNNDNCLCIGNSLECSEYLNISIRSFYNALARMKKKTYGYRSNKKIYAYEDD